MKAVELSGIQQMKIVDIPRPELHSDTDVLLNVGAVGVCGSDVHYYMTGKIGNQVVQYPFRVGHEFAGTVMEVGKQVRGIHPGARVAVDPAISCESCDQCISGRPHTCRNLRFLGCPGQAEGCLVETIVMPARCCYPVADSTTLEQAAIVEPLSIGVYAARLAGSLVQARIGILGCGPIGLSVALAAQAAGAGKIYMTDKIEERLHAAARAGAAWTGNPTREDVVRGISGEEPLLLDAVFECCGDQAALNQAVALLKPGGLLLVVGIPRMDRISFAVDDMRHKELRIQNVRRQNGCVREAIRLIESRTVDVDFMITHRYTLEQTQDAFEAVARYEDGVVKAMIRLDDTGSGEN